MGAYTASTSTVSAQVDQRPARIAQQQELVTGLLDSLLRSRSQELADYSVEEEQEWEDGRIRSVGVETRKRSRIMSRL